MQIEVKRGSLTEGDERVLVNASNTNVALGSGVSGAIRAACGAGYQAAITQALQERFGGPMEPGQVLITDAGKHPRARWVAHVAVMDYRQGFSGSSYPDLLLIRRACARLWPAIEALPGAEPLSVAMVALGAGTGNLGVRGPVQAACETLQAHIEGHPGSRIGRVAFYGYSLPEFASTLSVVSRFFPVPIPEEVRSLVESPE
jgi:O-acetyl-ADP-ribose deacetylase (regulator of RNase III)